VKKDFQETYYFDTEQDLRIQRSKSYSKIWLKKGKIHDEFREEIEVKFAREDFEKIEKIFLEIGFKIKIKWLRKRNEFRWDGIKVCVDCTKGYGYIIELEKLCEEGEKERTLEFLKQKLKELKIELTPEKNLRRNLSIMRRIGGN
jgi:predicted adenylyl cyclase CyaB